MDGVGGSGGDPRDAAEGAVERLAAAATAGEGQRPESPDSQDGYTSDMLVQGAEGPFDDDGDGAIASALGKRRPTGSPGGPSAKRSPARGSDDDDDDAYVDALEGDALAHLEQ